MSGHDGKSAARAADSGEEALRTDPQFYESIGELDGGRLIGSDRALYVKHVIASCDKTGAAAVAKLASDINNGKLGVVVCRS